MRVLRIRMSFQGDLQQPTHNARQRFGFSLPQQKVRGRNRLATGAAPSSASRHRKRTPVTPRPQLAANLAVQVGETIPRDDRA